MPFDKPATESYNTLLSDLVQNILRNSDHPGECGEYLTSQIRELIAVRMVALIGTQEGASPKLISICPERKLKEFNREGIQRFIHRSLTVNLPQLVDPAIDEIGIDLPELGKEKSFIIPLMVGEFRVGILLLIDLMDERGASKILDILTRISPILALILRNSYLYRNLENIVQLRTEELRKSEQLFKVLFEQSSVGVAQINAEFTRYLQINNKYGEILGYTASEMIQFNPGYLTVREDFEIEKTLLARLTSHELQNFSMDKRCRHKDGSLKWVHLSVSTVFEPLGAPEYFIAVIQDVTERKRAFDLLRESEEKFRSIASNTPDHIIVQDRELRYIMVVNPQLGLTEEDMIGKTDREIQDSEAIEKMTAVKRRVIETGQSIQFETTLKNLRGGKEYFKGMYIPKRDSSGVVNGLIGYFQNTTEQIKSQQKISQLASIVESSDDAIISKDLNGIILSWNKGAQRIFGYDEHEAIGKSISMLIPETRKSELQFILSSIRAGGHIEHFETYRLRKDGKTVQVSLTISPIQDAAGLMIAASTVARDITERIRAEEAIRQAQKLESIGTLAGGIAHDFNNLLSAVLGQISLAESKLPQDHAALMNLRKALKAAEHATELTRQLLAYSGKGKFMSVNIDLNHLVMENLQMLETSVPKTARILPELGGSFPHIQGDVGQIQQVIMNLIINAGDAIGPNPGTITIRTSEIELSGGDSEYWKFTDNPLPPGMYARLEVDDTGHGMDPEIVTRIFDPFFTTKFSGRGLGLAAVLGIIRAHNGGLRIHSQKGVGTQFDIVFPIIQAERKEKENKIEAVKLQGRGRTILVIDDEAVVLDFVSDLLEESGFNVLAANGALTGIKLFEANHPDVSAVILDYSMPDMDGKAVYEELLKIRRDIRVLVCSGYTEDEMVSAFGSSQPFAFIQKPYAFTSLFDVVGRMLSAS